MLAAGVFTKPPSCDSGDKEPAVTVACVAEGTDVGELALLPAAEPALIAEEKDELRRRFRFWKMPSGAPSLSLPACA